VLESHPDPDDLMALHRLFAESGVRRILDVGCGDGCVLTFFAEHGYELAGIDSDSRPLRRAQQTLTACHLEAELHCADLAELPFPEAAFDAVLCLRVLHQNRLRVARAALAEMRRVLAPGGWLFLTVPAGRPTEHQRDGLEVEPGTWLVCSRPERGTVRHVFSVEELTGLLAGFEVVRAAEDPHGFASILARSAPES
jgi:ubiquinone/menaquinone biosynthesis C-methylase UbiE